MTDLEVPISVSSLRTIAPCVSGDESPKFESTWTGYYLRRLQHYQSLLDYQGTTPSLSDDLNPACNPPLYRQRVEELFERRRVEPSLEPTRRVCVELQSPHQAYSCVHVAGTNGKGSVAFKTAMDLEAHGVHKVGLYTSPHLVSVRERLIINDIPVTHAQLLALLDVVESAGERLGIQLSFFATLTTAAFFWFSVEKVDIAVIETGIGGRLDATNIINKPICSIITRIGYDHTSTLGHTLAEIAREKAGIIKEDSVVVLGPNIECQSVFVETARARRAKDVYVIPFHGEDSPSRENARIAREGVKIVLEKLGIPLLQLPLVSVNLPGRFHVLDNDTAIESIRSNLALTHFEPAFITIDVGHNADAMEALARTMDSYIKANKSYVNDFVLFVSLSNGRTPKIFQPLFNYAQRNSISISKCIYLPGCHSRLKGRDSVHQSLTQTQGRTEAEERLLRDWDSEDMCVSEVLKKYLDGAHCTTGIIFAGSFYTISELRDAFGFSSFPLTSNFQNVITLKAPRHPSLL